MPDNLKFNAIVERYAGIEGRDLIAQVARDYAGRVALLSSFGAESSVLLHMLSEVAPDVPVLFLDTGKLFDETIRYRDQLVREFGLTDLRIIAPDEADIARTDPQGDLHGRDTDLCCHIRKTVPLARATATNRAAEGRLPALGQQNLEYFGSVSRFMLCLGTNR